MFLYLLVLFFLYFSITDTHDLRTPVITPFQPSRTRSDLDRRCVSIITNRVYLHVISLGIYLLPDVRKLKTSVLTF